MGIFSLCFRYGGRPFSFLLLSAVPQGYPSHSFLFPLPRSFNVSPFLCLSFWPPRLRLSPTLFYLHSSVVEYEITKHHYCIRSAKHCARSTKHIAANYISSVCLGLGYLDVICDRTAWVYGRSIQGLLLWERVSSPLIWVSLWRPMIYLFYLFILAYSLTRLRRRTFQTGFPVRCPCEVASCKPLCPPPSPVPREYDVHQRNHKGKEF